MFKNYHVVIFKDREGGFRNLRMSGWLGFLLFLMVIGLACFNFYLWGYYAKAIQLEHELQEAQTLNDSSAGQILSLTGKLQNLEEDIIRVQQFDAKLRVLMNIDKDSPSEEDAYATSNAAAGALNNPFFMARHRDLFNRRVHSLVDELSTNILLEEVQQQNLVSYLRSNNESLLSTPSIWPVKGFLTSGFGRRRAPLSGATSMHKGLDISNRPGTPIWAPARGTVTSSGYDGAYGISVTIDHGNNVITRYAHMQRTLVRAGQYVQRGDVIGALGNTGRSTGPHLHYEVIVGGVHVDPMRYILN